MRKRKGEKPLKPFPSGSNAGSTDQEATSKEWPMPILSKIASGQGDFFQCQHASR